MWVVWFVAGLGWFGLVWWGWAGFGGVGGVGGVVWVVVGVGVCWVWCWVFGLVWWVVGWCVPVFGYGGALAVNAPLWVGMWGAQPGPRSFVCPSPPMGVPLLGHLCGLQAVSLGGLGCPGGLGGCALVSSPWGEFSGLRSVFITVR